MTTLGPIAFYQTPLLSDFAALASGDNGTLVTLEHTHEMASGALSVLAEKTVWRFWQLDSKEAVFREVSQSTVAFPVAESVAITLHQGHLVALAQVNRRTAALLLSWEAPSFPPALSESSPKVTSLGLDPQQAEQVHLGPADDWSTSDLPSNRWLFYPALSSLPDGLVSVLNTADGRAIGWVTDGRTGAARSFVGIPRAINPAALHISGKNYLLFRRMPSPWPVYFHNTRYSGQFGPVALPLDLAELDGSGTPVRLTEVSNLAGLGEVFDFAVASDGLHRGALATIAGSKQRLELRVFALDAAGESLRQLYSAPLSRVPYRLSLAVLGGAVLVGLAQAREAGHSLEGMVIPWPP